MPTELKELELMEVSLVDAGDDPLAKVALFKRHPEGESMEKELDETEKAKLEIEVGEEEDETEEDMAEGEDKPKPARKSYKAEAETLKARNEELEAQVGVLEKALEEAKAVEKAKPQEEMIEVEGEMVAKSTVPAPVLKKLEELQKAAEKAELCKRADELLPNLKGTSEERGELLKAVGNSEALLAILKAADAAMAGAFEEIGKEKAADFLTAQEELDALIQQVVDEKGVSKHKATAEVTATAKGKALYKQVMKDRK